MKEEHVSFSRSNTKVGKNFPSVSFPPLVTCIKCGCNDVCYALKHIYILYENSRNAYNRNWHIYCTDKEKFWREVISVVMINKLFRWFVSGDIPDYDFVVRMCDVMTNNPHCQAICFTKKFDLVNEYLDKGGSIPDNLHLIFSAWKGLDMKNPYHLPECHIMYKDGTTTASDGAKWCSGNCTECFFEQKNCFTLQKGEQVLIKQH